MPLQARARRVWTRTCASARAHWDRLRSLTIVAIVVETIERFGADECPTRAAALAYYAFFSLFPLAIGLTALASWLLAGLELEDELLDVLVGYFPAAEGLIRENIAQAISLRGPATIVAVSGLIWSARAIFAAILDALHRAFGVERPRHIVLRTLVQIGLVLSVGLFFVLSLLATTVLRLLASVELPYIGWRPFANPPWEVLVALVPFAMSLVAFLVLYRFLPNAPIAWSDVLAGGVLAAVAFELAKQGFVWYTQNIARFELVYGSLGAVVALLLWAYISSLILLAGAELSATIYRRRRSTEAAGA